MIKASFNSTCGEINCVLEILDQCYSKRQSRIFGLFKLGFRDTLSHTDVLPWTLLIMSGDASYPLASVADTLSPSFGTSNLYLVTFRQKQYVVGFKKVCCSTSSWHRHDGLTLQVHWNLVCLLLRVPSVTGCEAKDKTLISDNPG